MGNKIDKVNRKISDMKKMKQRYCPEDWDGKEDFSARISHALPVRISHCLSAVYQPTLVPFYLFTLLLFLLVSCAKMAAGTTRRHPECSGHLLPSVLPM